MTSVPGVAEEVHPTPAPPLRQCGRCRNMFDGDPELWFQTDWCLCPACEGVLMPPR